MVKLNKTKCAILYYLFNKSNFPIHFYCKYVVRIVRKLFNIFIYHQVLIRSWPTRCVASSYSSWPVRYEGWPQLLQTFHTRTRFWKLVSSYFLHACEKNLAQQEILTTSSISTSGFIFAGVKVFHKCLYHSYVYQDYKQGKLNMRLKSQTHVPKNETDIGTSHVPQFENVITACILNSSYIGYRLISVLIHEWKHIYLHADRSEKKKFYDHESVKIDNQPTPNNYFNSFPLFVNVFKEWN